MRRAVSRGVGQRARVEKVRDEIPLLPASLLLGRPQLPLPHISTYVVHTTCIPRPQSDDPQYGKKVCGFSENFAFLQCQCQNFYKAQLIQ